jgi:hypothetical protein
LRKGPARRYVRVGLDGIPTAVLHFFWTRLKSLGMLHCRSED